MKRTALPRTLKARLPVDPLDILKRLARLRIETWNYKFEPGVRHIGPMAQDFAALFGVGDSPRHIQLGDAVGVAYAGIKGLNLILKKNDEKIVALRRDLKTIHRDIRLLRSKKRGPE